jgi:hypothetical protein
MASWIQSLSNAAAVARILEFEELMYLNPLFQRKFVEEIEK